MAEKQTPPTFEPQAHQQNPGEVDSFESEAARRIIVVPGREEPPRPSLDRNQPEPITTREPSPAVRVGTGFAAVSLLALGGIAGLDKLQDTLSPEHDEQDTTISSLSLGSEATLRADHSTLEDNSNPNILLNLGEGVTIETPDGVAIFESSNNGTWYGISEDDLTTKISLPPLARDDDGIIWVNEAGVTGINKDRGVAPLTADEPVS